MKEVNDVIDRKKKIFISEHNTTKIDNGILKKIQKFRYIVRKIFEKIQQKMKKISEILIDKSTNL